MNWLFSRRTVHSKKNGTMLIKRVLGRWRIFSGGNENTGPELTEIWEEAFKILLHAKQEAPVQNVLQLGFGAGGTIKEIYEYFPNCIIDAVDYDSQMIAVARTAKLWNPFPAPNIYEADAREFLKQVSKQYDLVLVDLFHDGKPSALLDDEIFMQSLKSAVKNGGTVLINVFRNPEYLCVANSVFSASTVLTLESNTLGLFY